MEPQIEIEVLTLGHDRASFLCGVAALDNYFQNYVTQDVRRNLAKCFVAVDKSNADKVAGYYTLSAGGILLDELPRDLAKGLPRYPLPVARMGRLAVDLNYRGQGLGAALLTHALDKAAQSDVKTFALVVDAKDDTAKSFYMRYGFRNYGSLPLQLILVFPKTK